MTDNPSSTKPKPLLDKNGNPVVNQFGHIVSARLTKEDEAAIDELVLEGKSQAEICKTLNVSHRRLLTYLDSTRTVERLERIQYAQSISRHMQETEYLLFQTVDLLGKMQKRLTAVEAQLKQTKVATRRTNIGRERAERDNRSNRNEVTRLRNLIWKKTGRRPEAP